MVYAMLARGAMASMVNDFGSNALKSACANSTTITENMLRAIAHDLDVNAQSLGEKRAILALLRASECAVKRGFGKRSGTKTTSSQRRTSEMLLDFAHTRGSTALHKAAQFGHTDVLVFLLSIGAHPSLTIRNAMGCTPLDIANIFGPFKETTSFLVQATLRQSFESRFIFADGRIMRRGSI